MKVLGVRWERRRIYYDQFINIIMVSMRWERAALSIGPWIEYENLDCGAGSGIRMWRVLQDTLQPRRARVRI